METDRSNMLPFCGHLEVLRWMLFRIIAVAGTLGIVIFCFKNFTWELLLAPSEYTFCTYKSIESIQADIIPLYSKPPQNARMITPRYL